MSTSNWQNIGYCVELIRRADPRSVLDIGAGFGRWGMITREFLEVWNGASFPEQWQRRVEAVEVFPRNIAPYHRSFYSEVHCTEALRFLDSCERRFDLIIIGDVLEHFSRSDGERLLDRALTTGRYVLLNLPLGNEWPQDARDENVYERHLSSWEWDEVTERYPVLRSRKFFDYIGRPFGTFLLAADPGDRFQFELRPYEGLPRAQLEQEIEAITASLAQEPERGVVLGAIEQEVAARLADGRDVSTLEIASVGRGSRSEGAEVWLLNLASPELPALTRSTVRSGEGFDHCAHRLSGTGSALVLLGEGSHATLSVAGSPLRLQFLNHPWSGRMQLKRDGELIAEADLSAGSGDIQEFMVP